MALSLALKPALAASVSGEMRQWHPLTVDFEGPAHSESDNQPNPFLDYRLTLQLTSPTGASIEVPGFFAGDGEGGGNGNVWRVRFSPDEAGQWQYTASFRSGAAVAIETDASAGSAMSFDGESGSFTVAERDSQAPGFLRYGALEYVGEHYLKFRDGPYWLKSGTDSPENLLAYNGFDNTQDQGGVGPTFLHSYDSHRADALPLSDPFFISPDTERDSLGLTGALNYLSSQGVNSVYFLPMNLGGDGQDTYPFISPANTRSAKTHFDISKLYQWSQIFDHAQRRGIALHVVLAETELANERWLDNGEFGLERRLFLRELVARFGFILGMKWNLSEENDFPADVLRQTAQYLQDIDWTAKPISVHTHIEAFQTYRQILGDNRFSASAIQYRIENAGRLTEQWRQLSREAGHPWVIDMDENTTALTTSNAELLRKQALYDVYFSGGNIEWYFGFLPLPPGGDVNLEDFRTRESMWTFMRHAREFMESNLPFWQMQPDDSLVTGESQDFGGAEVFALPGQVYSIYLPSATSDANIDLSFESGVEYQQRWFNPETGQFEGETRALNSDAQQSLGSPPSRAADDWVVLISRQASQQDEVLAEAEEPSPTVEEPIEAIAFNNLPAFQSLPRDLQVEAGELIEFRVAATDEDGPIPGITIADAPASSSLDDNFDGSRTFRWIPDDEDVGNRELIFITIDAVDATLRTEQTMALTILPRSSVQSIAAEEDQVVTEAAPDVQSETSDETATVADAQAETNASPDPVQESVAEVTLSPNGSAPDEDTAPETIPTAEPFTDSSDTETESPVSPVTITLALRPELESNLAPVLLVPDVPPVTVGSVIDLLFAPVDPEGLVPSLWMAGLPAGASLNDNGNGTRSFVWTPTAQDVGSYQLPIFVGDAADPTLIRELDLRLEIVAAIGVSVDDAADPSSENTGSAASDENVTPVRGTNQAPLFPAIAAPSIMVGTQLSLNVQPIDPEGSAPVLQVQNAPSGASFDDNGVGGRVLLWTPGPDDIGEHFVRFIAIDADDQALSTDIVRKITVLAGG